ncbi:MAG: hypothetical protein QGI50_09685 [Dehalococcoidia bacterium]|nr:hypothetical protein [Dehalococcoidia bacterium]MDP7201209.1 hypothetical protein [Dehalococcoidia bacterium]MDP7510325.1 hypothetical protein [Dehalococcoidia bacterium]HJN86977.1 hypothetical protein [Dehalococcoidia bacterium]
MGDDIMDPQDRQPPSSPLSGPPVNPAFAEALEELVAVARRGHKPDSPFFNPSNDWLTDRMSIFQDLSREKQEQILEEARQIAQEAEKANAAGKAAGRAWPEVVVRLDSGGLGFFSQLGVVRRPDLTQYFIDGFTRNRDALAFSEPNQALFAKVFSHIAKKMEEHFASGETIVQSDRKICDVPGRSFHARQLLFGTRYLQIPVMWRQLTFDCPDAERVRTPDILEVSLPEWLTSLGLPEDLKARIKESGLTQLVFKAPTKGLSLHLGFDYVGEHKMGPLTIAMFLVKQVKGLAVQAALSLARAKTLDGTMKNTAMVTVGPSLHGKSTLTIMLDLVNSELGKSLKLKVDPEEGVFPMNDDIVLVQPLPAPIETVRDGKPVRIPYSIDGTENNMYAMPFGLNQEEDPITYEAVRGTKEAPNTEEALENVPIDIDTGVPNFRLNPVRNMRVTLSRPRLVARKGAQHVIESVTSGQDSDTVHVPMERTDRVFWQAVMRLNTITPPLRRLNAKQFVRVLMYGEAVQMGAAIGTIGRPYVEYFSDPFIIGLEDENANLMYHILQQFEQGGLPQEYYAFNTGGVGADTNDEASGEGYKKVTRDLTLMLTEALLRGAVKFEHDPALRSDVAVAIVDAQGKEVLDLRKEWLPETIYGREEYIKRIAELSRIRYYGRDDQDKAGILRYTKVVNEMYDIEDIPNPANERELSWLLSFYWNVDQAYSSLPDLALHQGEGRRPPADTLEAIQKMYQAGRNQGLEVPVDSQGALAELGIRGNG